MSKKVPKRLSSYSLVHQAGISSMIACGKTGRTGIESVNVQTSEISEFMGFEFYDHVWWLDKKHPSTTDHNTIIGLWLEISHKIGGGIFY